MKKRSWDPEFEAGRLLTAYLGGAAIAIDPGGGREQLHDLDIQLADRTVIAVEVTRHNIEEHLAMLSAVDGRQWVFPTLESDWIVNVAPTFGVAAMHREIEGLLCSFEIASLDSLLLRDSLFDSAFDDVLDLDERADRELLRRSNTSAQAKRLHELGARLVHRFRGAGVGGGEVIVSEASRAGSSSPMVVVTMIEEHANRADNTAKLGAATDRAERHLFVWVEHSQMAAVAAFDFSKALPDGAGLPERALALPAAIDAAWAATAYDKSHVWQYHRLHGWRDLGTWDRDTNTITPA